MAVVAEDQQDYTRTASLHAETLGIAVELGDDRMVANCLEGIARIAIGAGEPRRAVRIIGAVESIWAAHPPAEISHWGHMRETKRLDQASERARIVLGEDQFVATLEAGKALSLADAAAEARTLAADLGAGER